MGHLCVLGSINMDTVFRVPRLPHVGETLHSTQMSLIPGGKGANQAIAAARLGMATEMIGAVGSDEHGSTLLKGLLDHQVGAQGIERVGGSSGLAFITVDGNAQNTIVLLGGANQQVSVPMVERHKRLILDSSALLLQLEIPLDSVRIGIELSKGAGIPVFLNAAPALELPSQLLAVVDYLIVNETEAEMLLKTPIDLPAGALDAAAALCGLGVKYSIITLGEWGAALVGPSTRVTVPSYSVDVVDTTAAGDAFVAAFLSAVIQHNWDLEEALRFGCAAGAAACTVLGAQPSLPTVNQVHLLLERHPTGLGSSDRRPKGGGA